MGLLALLHRLKGKSSQSLETYPKSWKFFLFSSWGHIPNTHSLHWHHMQSLVKLKSAHVQENLEAQN